MSTVLAKLEDLVKALELGSFNAAPGSLVQGSALQVEDVSPVMHNVCFQDKHIKLQKEIKVDKAKGQLIQFNRQISYGSAFNGMAQAEGQVGQEETSDFVRAVVPMAYYSHIRRVTIAANMAETHDGTKAEDREAEAAAKLMAGTIERDLFLGKDDFSNAGVFDGSIAAMPDRLPNMVGLGVQIRQSDAQLNTHDLMFEAFGGNLSNIISGGGVLTQSMIEDAWIRGVMNHGDADDLYVDPLVLSAYSKNTYLTAASQRVVLSNSSQDLVGGADVSRQSVSGGVVKVHASRFLSAQTRPERSRATSPAAPTIAVGGGTGHAAGGALAAGAYTYFATAVNELGESVKSADLTITCLVNEKIMIDLGAVTNARFFNVFRSPVGGTSAQAKLVGKVKVAASGATAFTDLGNRIQGGITGFLVDHESMGMKELSPYSRLKLAVTSLNIPEASFRFCCLAVWTPRTNVVIDNLVGSL